MVGLVEEVLGGWGLAWNLKTLIKQWPFELFQEASVVYSALCPGPTKYVNKYFPKFLGPQSLSLHTVWGLVMISEGESGWVV